MLRSLVLGALLPAVAAAAPDSATGKSPKHLLVTVIDDLGFDDFGYTNDNQIQTPTFNELRAHGVGFTQYYVQPSCSPTRATILTGRKPVHTGINFWIPNAAYGLPLNETTLAQVMNNRGFKSHAVGKVSDPAPPSSFPTPTPYLTAWVCAGSGTWAYTSQPTSPPSAGSTGESWTDWTAASY